MQLEASFCLGKGRRGYSRSADGKLVYIYVCVTKYSSEERRGSGNMESVFLRLKNDGRVEIVGRP